jgi:prevent-host-death family protein
MNPRTSHRHRTIMASRLPAECLSILDEVERTGMSVTITKRGRAIARIVPLTDPDGPRSTMGSVRLVAADDAAYYSTRERWGVEP